MPSPFAHAVVGFALFRAFGRRLLSRPGDVRWPVALAATVAFSVLPDLDALPGLVLGDLGRFHNNLAGSPIFGALAALVAAGAVWLWTRRAFGLWFAVALACYEIHVLMDYLTVGRGIMLLWPFSEARFAPPFHAFYGLRWSDGLWSERHVWTLLSELGFAVVVLGAAEWLARREDRLSGPAPR